ncbi:hypothetical protein OVA14_07295 [Agrococcus sp. SL85]|uniref:hypothetical protein n=1 Tax=Agrococcus sp. SL85 TaxID=2995141 RepID=UPI00226CC580|nr:hypothetical protein [Agrococcus sp. SL85]WAC65198.1 hypothetical protein OVA14_07295 [Agrococcus sp. SL85]
MNSIPSAALVLAALTASLVLAGCATTQPAPAAPVAQQVNVPAAYDVEEAQARLVEAVSAGWVDTLPPEPHWIEATALLICKRQGVNVPQFTDNPANQELMIESALTIFCAD